MASPSIPDEKKMLDNLGKIAYTLDKAYLSRLDSDDYAPLLFDEVFNKEEAISFLSNIRALKVNRWVLDQEENPGECFKNVLSLFADGGHTIAMVLKRTPKGAEMFFVTKNEGAGKNEDSANNIELLEQSIKGNFPGTNTEIIYRNDIEQLEEFFSFPSACAISALVNTPSEYSEDYITQGLDKLLNGIVPESDNDSYSVVFLAESLAPKQIQEILSGFEDMATAIHPFLTYQFQTGKNKTKTTGEMRSISNSESISDATFKTHSVNVGLNGSLNLGSTFGFAKTVGKSLAKSITGSVSAGYSGGLFGGPNVSATVGGSRTNTESESMANSSGSSRGFSLGISAGYGYSWGTSKTVTNGSTDTEGTNSSVAIGGTENTSYTYKSYLIENLLEKLQKTMERINQSQAVGLWKSSVYVLAQDAKVSKNVANFLRAVTQGKDSFIERSAIQTWIKKSDSDRSPFDEVLKYLSHFCHPVFYTDSKDENDNAMLVTPTAYVGSDELSHVMVFPKNSVQGLPVQQCAKFGREPCTLLKTVQNLEIGSAYHMHEVSTTQRIKLSEEELTKHTFITGSTGSGKSNTIYKLLENLSEQEVKFLVIEPAKGEYKTAFGARDDVTVYGTNPKLSRLLRLDPFRFPKNTHVLEHLDRLVEIFNVCWPMYAAMPAILKDAMERAYVSAGWDLMKSENQYVPDLFPTFADVLREIRNVLNESEYSADNKGDYTGALVTRLRSLTNGINGLIFQSKDIPDRELFEKNVIVDLSRVGSTETKALIMGLLVLKLQEYHMEQSEPNAKLSHVTVLEEAHNLLKRTSTEQATEGANLLGKSVEMLANAIAEMRTYGEGFIIADQSPGLLDMSVIRNTNTKIILRLPDFSDRELVGKAGGLNDQQIIELSRLERGVAAVSQSDWLEPVLCKIDKFEAPFQDNGKSKNNLADGDAVFNDDNAEKSLLDCIMNQEIYRKGDRVDIEKLSKDIIKSHLSTPVKRVFLDYVSADEADFLPALRKLVYEFFNAGAAIESAQNCGTVEEWVHSVVNTLKPSVKDYSNQQIDLLVALITYEQSLRNKDYVDIFNRYTELYQAKGGVY